eukprot:3232277-Pyramimonas_sp.AAC.2
MGLLCDMFSLETNRNMMYSPMWSRVCQFVVLTPPGASECAKSGACGRARGLPQELDASAGPGASHRRVCRGEQVH